MELTNKPRLQVHKITKDIKLKLDYNLQRQVSIVTIVNHSKVSRALEQLRPGFHYWSSRPEFTGRVDGPELWCIFDTRVDG